MLAESLKHYLDIRGRIRDFIESSCDRTKLEDLVELAFRSGDRDIIISKKDFISMMGTLNRKSLKDFLFKCEHLGLLTEKNSESSFYHLQLTSKLLGGDHVLPARQAELTIAYTNPGKAETEEMGQKQDKTIFKYNEEIADLLKEVTDSNELLPSSEALVKSFRDRAEQIRKKVRTFEARHETSLQTEITNINSILRILAISSPKKEAPKKQQALPMNPKSFVKYFYSYLARRTQTLTECKAWPAEVKTAKEIISRFHEMKKDESFIKRFIEWVIDTHPDKVNMFYLKFKITDFLQTLDDKEQWAIRYREFIDRGGKPDTQEELTCYFVKLYEDIYGRYSPVSTYTRDMGDMSNIFKYLGSHIDKVALFIRWAMEVAAPRLKQVPSRPAALMKFISEFDQQFDQLMREEDDGLDEETKKAIKMSQLLIKRAHTRRDVSFEGAERAKLEKCLEKTKFTDLDVEAQSIVNMYPDAFIVIDNKIQLVKENELV